MASDGNIAGTQTHDPVVPGASNTDPRGGYFGSLGSRIEKLPTPLRPSSVSVKTMTPTTPSVAEIDSGWKIASSHQPSDYGFIALLRLQISSTYSSKCSCEGTSVLDPNWRLRASR